jgi:RecB family exonuclease
LKPFLKELAEKILEKHSKLDELTLVFPNRRAALFFRKYLAESINKPTWSPKLISIEELFAQHSTLIEADRLDLIFRLFTVYREVMQHEESFDQFYFWGDMLLRDFNEVDKYLANAPLLFKDLSKLRELDESFDYLTDEQKEFLKDFWLNFQDKPNSSKDEFLKIWRGLPKVYTEFTKALQSEGLGYEGMIHRQVAEKIKKLKEEACAHQSVVFAGFNALTRSEETVMSYYVAHGASVYWDIDTYYVNNKIQEAGQFFRIYKNHTILGKTFSNTIPSHFSDPERKKVINLIGVPQKIGQAKLVGQQLQADFNQGLDAEKTVIVLADESMLLPMLHSLPQQVESINVTMGYPLRNVPLYSLLDLVIDLQLNKKGVYFSHREVVAILSHAHVLMLDAKVAHRTRLDIIHYNQLAITASALQVTPFLTLLFQEIEDKYIATYLLAIIQAVGEKLGNQSSLDQEYTYHFHTLVTRLREVLNTSNTHPDLKGFQKLFRQVIQSQRIPFAGEPLKGLQIMGVLETRNLDFENVFVLSLNEGLLPAAAKQGSYIPNAIRKAYMLPTNEHQDAIYAYLFYRVLQRAKNITLIYSTTADTLGMGEMSRYVKQLINESGWKINEFMLTNQLQISTASPIVINKDEVMLELMRTKYTDQNGRGLSPSALNEYIECSLKFYLKHIAGLTEAAEVEEDLDARVFGNFLHDIMHGFYADLIESKKEKLVLADDFNEVTVALKLSALTDKAFIKHYNLDPEKEVTYQGQRVVVKEIVKKFAERILSFDKNYAPFYIELLEDKDFFVTFPLKITGTEQPLKLAGRIDRVDSKDGIVRVIDYKTGSDKTTFESMASFFSREGKRNKAAFQTVLYSWMYFKKTKHTELIIKQLTPGLINRENVFNENFKLAFDMGKHSEKVTLYDVRPHLNEFEQHLNVLVEEIFNQNIPFVQTTEEKTCAYCAYKTICRR